MSAKELAVTAWGAALPEWIRMMAEDCDASSMRKVALKIGVSPALVSLAIRNKHHSGLGYLESCWNKQITSVECPVLGAISGHECRQNQEKKFSSINPLAVRLYRACHGECPFGGRNGQ